MAVARSQWVVLATVTLNMAGVGLVWPILPTLVETLSDGSVSSTAALVGLISVVYALMQFLFAPLIGGLSDRYGRKPVMLLALAGLGLDNLFLALAPTIAWVLVGRALGGIFGATFAVANAYMADVTEGKDRAAAFGLVGAAFGLGFILGPLIGGVLGEIGLRVPFYFAAVLSVLNLIFGLFFLEETLPQEKRGDAGSSNRGMLKALGWMAANPVILPLSVALLIANTVQRGLEAVWVLFTGVQYGWGMREAGFSLAVVGICYVFVQAVMVRHVVKRFGEVATLVGGFTVSAAMYVVLSFNEIGLIGYLGIIPYVLGWGVAGPALQALASQQASAQEQGLLQGGLSAVNGMAAIVGPAISAAMFAFSTNPATPLYFPGAFFLAGSLLLLLAAGIGATAARNLG